MAILALQQLAQHISAQAVGAFDEFAGFLQGLAHANLAQQFQQCALRRRHLRRPAALLERADVQQGVRLLYSVEDDHLLVTVVAVDKREDGVVYESAIARLSAAAAALTKALREKLNK